ncbi:hypothetical protein, partial [Nocardia salmonicida]|uniref:hypothetical protein n=1 Tax=Nocardia salmonicida TaxID=53431 RepID=UPI001BDEA017
STGHRATLRAPALRGTTGRTLRARSGGRHRPTRRGTAGTITRLRGETRLRTPSRTTAARIIAVGGGLVGRTH